MGRLFKKSDAEIDAQIDDAWYDGEKPKAQPDPDILREDSGHLPDTPANRKLLLDLVRDGKYSCWHRGEMRMNKDEKMSKFELFCMIFYMLDSYWEDTRDEDLAMFLSDMNPFLFGGENSAVPSTFHEFCDFMPDDITLGNSYALAEKYIASLSATPFYNPEHFARAFHTVTQDVSWIDTTVDFLTEWRKEKAEESQTS